MNRRDRRKLKKRGIQVPKDPSINIKLSDLGRDIMTPTMESAMMHEINQQCLEADKRFSLDLDTMVIFDLKEEVSEAKEAKLLRLQKRIVRDTGEQDYATSLTRKWLDDHTQKAVHDAVFLTSSHELKNPE